MSICEELGLSRDELDGLDLEWMEDTGSSDSTVYGYYAYVPAHTPTVILARNGWSVGEKIDVSVSAFEDDSWN